MHVEAVGEHQRRAVLHVGVQMVAIDVALQFVGRQHHHHVGPLGGLGHFHDLELLALGLLDARRGLAQRDRDVLDAAVAQIERVGMALAAIADDGDLLALDQVQVGITIVVNTHSLNPLDGHGPGLVLPVVLLWPLARPGQARRMGAGKSLSQRSAAPVLLYFGPGVGPHPAFPSPSKRGVGAPGGAGERAKLPDRLCESRSTPRFRDPSALRGGVGVPRRGPLRGARRLPALQRDAGCRAPRPVLSSNAAIDGDRRKNKTRTTYIPTPRLSTRPLIVILV